MCTPNSIFHNDHSEAVVRCSEPSFFFANVSATKLSMVTSFTCRHCSRFWTLQVGVQIETVLKQELQVLQVAAALAQVVTCGLIVSIATAERNRNPDRQML